jgi:hypothetical protein
MAEVPTWVPGFLRTLDKSADPTQCATHGSSPLVLVKGPTTKLSSGGAPVSCGHEKRIVPRRLLQRLVRRAFTPPTTPRGGWR